ncbi:jg23811 [Pararge aegeria aegeria]|uniref:Jg23811 protein n=1 Tax=Pararge aegeria aegeria TaxID=348720 RepID=A0A8S4SJJ6_9NEOP|nr:jg23811 [Pararge aegeria aegeria]
MDRHTDGHVPPRYQFTCRLDISTFERESGRVGEHSLPLALNMRRARSTTGGQAPRGGRAGLKVAEESANVSLLDGEPTALTLGARGSLSRALLHGLLAPTPAPRHHLYTAPNTGSLPPSPADSGVSDVESSSSGAGSAEELKARLQPPPPAPFHTPFLPFYQQHQIASSLQHHVATHPRPPDPRASGAVTLAGSQLASIPHPSPVKLPNYSETQR